MENNKLTPQKEFNKKVFSQRQENTDGMQHKVKFSTIWQLVCLPIQFKVVP